MATTQLPLSSGITPTQCAITGVNPNLRSPYVTTWTLVLEHAITNNLGLEVAYVGNHGTKLISLTDVNEPPIGAGWTAAAKAACLASVSDATPYGNCSPSSAAEQAARPYNAKFPYLSYIDILGNGDTSNYNGLQITLTERTSHGLSFVAGYTYSHALDDSSDNEGTLKVPIGPQAGIIYKQRFRHSPPFYAYWNLRAPREEGVCANVRGLVSQLRRGSSKRFAVGRWGCLRRFQRNWRNK